MLGIATFFSAHGDVTVTMVKKGKLIKFSIKDVSAEILPTTFNETATGVDRIVKPNLALKMVQ